MLSGAIAKARPDVDSLAPTRAYEPVDAPQADQARRRDRRPGLIAARKGLRLARLGR